jgi:putative hemolysin
VFRDSTTFSESRLSPDELQQLVEEAATTGALPTAAGEIASRAIDLAGLRVRDILVPRSRVVAIPVSATRDEVVSLLKHSPHARYPVYDQAIDNALGYVTTRELYEQLLDSPRFELRRLVRPLLFFPDTTPVVQAMRRFQEERQRFSLVIDETGGVVGVITMGDVSEELIGEVLDEHEAPDQFVRKEGEGLFSVRGDAPIHEVERALSLTLADDDTRSVTIAGLVIERLGHIPKRGEQVALTGELDVEVADASERRIRSLTVRLRPEPAVSV